MIRDLMRVVVHFSLAYQHCSSSPCLCFSSSILLCCSGSILSAQEGMNAYGRMGVARKCTHCYTGSSYPFTIPPSPPKMATALLVLSIVFLSRPTIPISAATSSSSSSPSSFSPRDDYLIDCGATNFAALPDGRIFKTNDQSKSLLDAKDDISISVPEGDVPVSIYLNARIFKQEATYNFNMSRAGWHWVRLHFYPMNNSEYNLQNAVFSVNTDEYVLIHNFDMNNRTRWLFKEYLVNVTNQNFTLKFVPKTGSFAFINAIEVVSAPDSLISDSGSALFPVGPFSGLSNFAYEVMHRVNVGGHLVTPQNDTLGRTWSPDRPYLKSENLAKNVSVAPKAITYPDDDAVTPLIAPQSVYASAVQMSDAEVNLQNFNITWEFKVDQGFGYMVRMHFCDIVSKSLNDLYFNVYVNGKMAISALDLSSFNNQLAVPYYKDLVVNASLMSDKLSFQIGSMNDVNGQRNAIANGIEILKMSNSVKSLDGTFGVDGKEAPETTASSGKKTVAAVGFAMMFGAFVGLGAMVIKWHKRPQDWQKRNSFSSWLLPVHASDTSFLASKTSIGSHKSGFYSSTMLGRYFSFSELQEATKNFDSNAIIGVGGFGNVYLGEIDDGTKVAVKRGNSQSEQGINEFQTEIQLLSKLRHRHLVSLIGYCDENSEMILVYEYMANGAFRDHLYGKNLPSMSWKQRLEICIGAARGLHYLHTGASQGIIHRDVKTTNILLDDNLIAKVADFGLSKCGPTMEQTHVSTAVKGSFGYLDPEYFRRQQLTDKSDVYSFGVVLLETLCVRPAINPALPREQVNLAEWAMQNKRKGLLEKIIDPVLVGAINPESMKKFAEAAEKCLAEHGVDRPTMGDVLWNLEYALQLHDASLPDKTEPSSLANIDPPSSATASAPGLSTLLEEDTVESEQANDEQSEKKRSGQFADLSGR